MSHPAHPDATGDRIHDESHDAGDHGRHPGVGEVVKGILRRAVLPGIVVFLIVLGIGWVIKSVFNNLPGEEGISQWFAGLRNPTLDSITHVISTSNDTWWTIGLAIVFSLIVWALTRRWWVGILPVLAISLEASIFVAATQLTGRPRPTVEHLDPAPPTSSYPSGHTAASFALYWTLALISQRIRNSALRSVLTVIFVVWPFLVGTARLYRGMHHLSDVLVGAVLGIWCAWTAFRCVQINRDDWDSGRTRA